MISISHAEMQAKMIKSRGFVSKFNTHTCARYGIMDTRAGETLQNGAACVAAKGAKNGKNPFFCLL